MRIEHVAIWVRDLEGMRDFYEQYFGCQSNEKYHNTVKGFESYFLTFESDARIELMRRVDVTERVSSELLGWAHIAISLGGKERVDELTSNLQQDGYTKVNGPRTTGDGYYESVVEDPEGNLIELTV